MHGRRSVSQRSQRCQRRQAGEAGEPSIGSGVPRPDPEQVPQGDAQEPVANVPPEYMAQFMEEMRRSQREFMDQTRGMWRGVGGQEGHPPQTGVAQGNAEEGSDSDHRRSERQMRRSRLFLDYCKAAPPTFTGDGDPIVAQNFIINSETRFDSLGIPDKRKVKLATSQLEGAAQKWWRNTKSVHGSRMTWQEFVSLFYEQYFPPELQRAKQLEFHTLVQGPEMSVLEYAQRFNELGEFCPQEMKDEVGKALKFEGGLKLEIRTQLATHLGDTYGNILSRALKAESDMKRVAALSDSRSSNPSQTTRSSSGHG